jgi:hypothetical protein
MPDIISSRVSQFNRIGHRISDVGALALLAAAKSRRQERHRL